MTAKGTFFPRRINSHVPAMQYAADVRFGGFGTVVLGAPAAADTDAVKAALVANATGTTYVDYEVDAKFGRNLTVTASVATGANSTAIIRGKDYLGQPMVETVTVTNANGTTTQVGKKAFKWVESIEIGVATTGATFDIGVGNVLGLPYKALKLTDEFVDKVVPANAGTFVDGLTTGAAQSVTSDDPKGTYTPHSSVVPDGARSYMLGCIFDTDNLEGDAHYYA